MVQMIDLNGDSKPESVIFQSGFGPKETKTLTLKESSAWATYPPEKSQVMARHVPERHDDWAWENDRVGFRVYGKELETVEPGSSGIDAWQKNTRELVMNKWYKGEQEGKLNYHKDYGQGLDGYKVGKGRGCGGAAVWKNDKMYDSGIKGWRTNKILANGPIRVVFELGYEPYEANGENVTELRRITLDAGSNLNRLDCTFTSDKPGQQMQIAIGLAKHPKPGEAAMHKEQGWIRYWDAVDTIDKPPKDNGNVGTGVVIDPALVIDTKEISDHVLIIAKAQSGKPLTYWTGDGWDKSGDFTDVKAWDAYLENAAKRIKSPLKVSITK
jgi:pectinesterase